MRLGRIDTRRCSLVGILNSLRQACSSCSTLFCTLGQWPLYHRHRRSTKIKPWLFDTERSGNEEVFTRCCPVGCEMMNGSHLRYLSSALENHRKSSLFCLSHITSLLHPLSFVGDSKFGDNTFNQNVRCGNWSYLKQFWTAECLMKLTYLNSAVPFARVYKHETVLKVREHLSWSLYIR